MVPLSPEAQGLLNRYNLTYDEVLFHQSYHQIGIYCLLTGVTMMLWDHITTIPEEIAYVWQGQDRWTLVTAVFSFNRYISPLGFLLRLAYYLMQNPEQPLCTISQIAAHWNIISFACVEVILMLRVWVMYGRDRKMGIFLSTLYMVSLIISLILHGKDPLPLIDIGLVPPFPMPLTLCERSTSSGYFWIFIIGASLETITFFLFCAKVYVSWKDSLSTPILSAFIAQGATYYFVVLCFFGISIAATMNKKMYLPLIDPNAVSLVSCIACSRLILSLRGLSHDHAETKGEYRATSAARVAVLSTWLSAISTSPDTSLTVIYD